MAIDVQNNKSVKTHQSSVQKMLYQLFTLTAVSRKHAMHFTESNLNKFRQRGIQQHHSYSCKVTSSTYENRHKFCWFTNQIDSIILKSLV